MKNNVFDGSRFGKYLAHDLFTVRSKYGLSFLLLAFLPVILLLIGVLMKLTWHSIDLQNLNAVTIIDIAYVVLFFSFPVKVYGDITAPKTGSDWVLLPASTLEKFLSMMVIELVIVPVVFSVLLFGGEALMSLVTGREPAWISMEPINNGLLFWWGVWCWNILVLTLGAILFKKSKVAKTILCSFAIGLVALFIFCGIAGSFSWDSESVQLWIERFDGDNAETAIKWFVGVLTAILYGALLSGIYFRLKKIKF